LRRAASHRQHEALLNRHSGAAHRFSVLLAKVVVHTRDHTQAPGRKDMRIPAFAASIALVSLAAGLALTSGHVGIAQTDEGGGDMSDIPFTGEDAVIPFVIPESGPFNPEEIEVENNQAISDWFRSAHADAAAEAFTHWDEDEEIRPVCAVCHAGEGFRSFHGLDGSEPGIPETPIDTGGVVDCATCHNPGLANITEIRMPSGVMHPVSGVEASCMTCHQGRTAGATVTEAVGDTPDDTPNPELSFVNPHYATAAAT
jgi:cytochrome c5